MFKISIEPEEIEQMPLGSFPGEIVVVSKAGRDYNAAIKYLKQQEIIGFDTETRPVFNPGEKHHGTALLQLSGPDKAFLFRVQSLGMRHRLCNILASDRILKVGAASADDLRGLQRYTKFEGKNFVDLQKVGWEWGIRDKSVKKMAAIILGVKISKAQQLSNWEAPELTAPQQMYAATDAWICREMYLKLMESEKHPLTPDEMISPKEKAAREEQHRKQMEAAALAAAENPDAKPKKKRRPHHHHKKKTATANVNVQSNPEEGAR